MPVRILTAPDDSDTVDPDDSMTDPLPCGLPEDPAINEPLPLAPDPVLTVTDPPTDAALALAPALRSTSLDESTRLLPDEPAALPTDRAILPGAPLSDAPVMMLTDPLPAVCDAELRIITDPLTASAADPLSISTSPPTPPELDPPDIDMKLPLMPAPEL
jgi:hypothetical protein